ncbi:MAG TPA: hypothetical protein VKV95_19810 [Terriglobia bacterium]|nr:hypothetical protein [Terriglobia bacterium]
MKRIFAFEKMVPFGLALVFCAPFMLAKNPSKTVDYSGNWALDFSQTKNPPAGLQDYSMAVKQDGHQVKVDTSLQGNLQPADNSNQYPGSGGGGYPGGRRGGGGMGGGMGRIGMPMPGGGGMGMPGGGMGMPGGGGGGGRGGRSRPDDRMGGNPAAYKLYPQTAVYNLDGSETNAQFGDQDSTAATSKAEWGKDGELKFSLVGKDDSGQKSSKVEVKDQWKLSEDGQTLKVERSVHSPEGSGTVHLVFHKQAADAAKAADPAQ